VRQDHFEHRGRLLSYLDAPGPAVAGRAPALLVFLHAFPLEAAMWAPQLASVPAGWRAVALDLAGFGRSFPVPTSATIDDDARDVLALLDHLGADEAVVAGLSMGGYVAFGMLRVAPTRLRGLVLADTRPEADSDEARRSRGEMLTTLDRQGIPAVVEAMLPRLLGPTSREGRPDVVTRVRALGMQQTREGVKAAVHRLMTRPDSTPLLSAIRCPTLVIVGAEDAITSPEIARAMQGRIPGAQFAVVEGAGHLSSLEAPDAFNAALYGFLT
jgi:pimeloyl-ACP methyl ester carboxylesterase